MEIAKNGKAIFTDQIADEIVEACAKGFTMEKSADLVGIGLSTLHAWVKKRPALGVRIKTARKKHELSLLASVEQAGEKSWQARAWILERAYSYAVPSVSKLQVSGNVEHGMNAGLAAMLAGVASRRREKQAEVIEIDGNTTPEIKQIPNRIQSADIERVGQDSEKHLSQIGYCAKPCTSSDYQSLEQANPPKKRHQRMRLRKPRKVNSEKLQMKLIDQGNALPTTTPLPTPPSPPDTHKTPPSNCDSK